MSEPKFTKGPWKCTKTKDYYNLGVTEHYYDLYEIKDENNKIITKLDAEGMEKDKNIKENAALIAAAPDMYGLLYQILINSFETLEQTIDELGNPIIVIPNDIFDKISPILKKARGEK